MKQMVLVCDNKLQRHTDNKCMVESTMSEFDSEIKSAWMVKITEIWLLGLWLLEQKNRESRVCSHSTHPQNLENPDHSKEAMMQIQNLN